MNSDLVLKKQFEDVSSQIKSKQSSIPESVSPLIDVLLSLFQIMFEMSSNQNRELRQSIEKQTQTIDNQTQTIEKQTQTFSFIIVATIKFVVIIKEFLCHLKLQGMLFHSKKRLFYIIFSLKFLLLMRP